MQYNMESFNEKENLIKEYKYWKLLISDKPNKFARLFAVLKREAFPFSTILPEEMEEYTQVIKDAEQALQQAFNAYLVQHVMLTFKVKQIHFNIIPRYNDEIKFEDITWVDDQNPDPLVQENIQITRETLNKILDILKENIN